MPFDPLQSNCSYCGAAAGVECDWGGVENHPRFHADRLEVEQFSEAITQGAADTQEWKTAVDGAAADLVD
ncbi:MAG TPA: hypothetical protein VMD97_01985 [Candidatus Aquilonibacter sp.]|nr:hypothetical protein [Candidatus Aquilonibacter sp.]